MKIQEIVPYLSVTNASQAIDFYSEVFESKPYLLLKMPNETIMHCEFRLENTRFFISEELPEHGGTPSPNSLNATSVAIHLYVADCDQMVESFREKGADVLMEPVDMFWGERFSRVRDPFGHEWGVSTVLKEMSPEEIQQSASRMFEEMKK